MHFESQKSDFHKLEKVTFLAYVQHFMCKQMANKMTSSLFLSLGKAGKKSRYKNEKLKRKIRPIPKLFYKLKGVR